jgi:hypothetical protein
LYASTQACLSSSGNVANRFNPMNAVLILYQFIRCTHIKDKPDING